MSTNKSLRVAVIGAGLMGGTHLASLADIIKRGLLPIEIVGIADGDPKRLKKAAAKHATKGFADAAEMLRTVRPDAVVIATPTGSHLPLVRAAAKQKCAIFLEKPIGRDLKEAEEIARLLAPLPHQIGLILRFSPTYNALKALCDDPTNGAFIACRFRDDQDFPTTKNYGSNWRADVKAAGGGTLIEHSIHDVDVLHWFFGPGTVEHADFLPSHAKGIEKLAALALRFKSGGVAQLLSVWHANPSRENERQIELFFEKRYFATDGGFRTPIHTQGPMGKAMIVTQEDVEKRFLKMIQWRDTANADFPLTAGYELYVFLEALARGETPRAVTAETGLAAHRTIEAAYATARRGKKR